MMQRSDLGRALYIIGIAACGWMTYEMYLTGEDVQGAMPYVSLMAVTVASMVSLLIVSVVHRSLLDRSRVPIALTVVSGPRKEMLRARGIVGKMPPMMR